MTGHYSTIPSEAEGSFATKEDSSTALGMTDLYSETK